ncbi:hypothetical protein BASA81_001031 [Batrachochytrium salamandrivorans]|nr:hypothetical protein BASA81_001031 [Batrachochytrium salamandrivorans]
MFEPGMSARALQQRYKEYTKEMAITFPVLRRKLEGGLRIVTYNVHMEHNYFARSAYDEGGDRMTALVHQLDPDVICFQEVESRPERLCPPPLCFSMFQQLFSGYGNGICSRFPIKDLLNVVYSAGRGTSEHRGLLGCTVCAPNRPEIRVYTTHLDVYDESGRTRLRQVTELHELISQDLAQLKFTGPVLLMGDFNAMHRPHYPHQANPALSRSWEQIVQHDLTRGLQHETSTMDYLLNLSHNRWWDVFGLQPPLVTSWAMRRIDFILIKATHLLLGKVEAWVAFDCASDHLPVVVDWSVEG